MVSEMIPVYPLCGLGNIWGNIICRSGWARIGVGFVLYN